MIKALIAFPHSFFMKKVGGLPLITRIIRNLQAIGIYDIYIMSNILNLEENGNIKIIKKKEEIQEKLGDDFLLIDIPAVFNSVFLKEVLMAYQEGRIILSSLQNKKWQGVFIPLEKEEDVKKAEKALLNSLRKPYDTLISRTLNRPVSLFISSLLMRTPITPNMITLIVFLIALLSCFFLIAYPTYWGGVLGGFLLHVSSVLDGCDGEIARLKFQGSKLGTWLDNMSDEASNFLFFGSLGIYCNAFYKDNLYLYIGFGIMGTFLITKTFQYILILMGHQEKDIAKYEFSFEHQEHKGIKKFLMFFFNLGKNLIRNDFLKLGMFIGGILGWLHIGLFVAALFILSLFLTVQVDFLKKVMLKK